MYGAHAPHTVEYQIYRGEATHSSDGGAAAGSPPLLRSFRKADQIFCQRAYPMATKIMVEGFMKCSDQQQRRN